MQLEAKSLGRNRKQNKQSENPVRTDNIWETKLEKKNKTKREAIGQTQDVNQKHSATNTNHNRGFLRNKNQDIT